MGRSSRTSSRSSSRSATERQPADGTLTTIRREALAGPTLDAARALLGARLVRDGAAGDGVVGGDDDVDRRVGRIVEVEAYIGEDDQASHARFGPTARNRVMYGPPGIAYVYLVYGMYDCLNVVTEPPGRPAAVLVRAVEPIAGVRAMRLARIAALARRRRPDEARRQAERERIEGLPVAHLARGPGLVTAAFGIDRSVTGLDLLDPRSPIRLEPPEPRDRAPEPVATPRVGIAYAGLPWVARPWRLVDASSMALSGPRAPAPRD